MAGVDSVGLSPHSPVQAQLWKENLPVQLISSRHHSGSSLS